MKKHILLLTLLLAGSVTVTYAQQNVSFGPNAGFGHTWINHYGKKQYQPAGNFGVSLLYSANDHIGLGIDMKYSIEGGKSELGGLTYNDKLNYLRIPVKAIYFFREYGDRIRPKVSLGPSVGFLVGGKQKYGNVVNESKNAYKGVDFGFLADAGIHARLIASTWLTIDMSYYHGISDVSENAQVMNRNRNIQLNVGLAFGIAQTKNDY